MGEVVNLNRVRKARRQAEEAREAEANRIRHGRGKAEKENDRRARQRHERLVEGARREEPDEPA